MAYTVFNASSDFQGPLRIVKIDLDADFGNTEQSSGFAFPAKAIVTNVWLDVTTADTSQSLDVGTLSSASGDADGFLDGASVNALGLVGPGLPNGAATRGALLRDNEDGSGAWVPRHDFTAGGKTVTYTGSDTTNTVRGAIFIEYIDVSAIA